MFGKIEELLVILLIVLVLFGGKQVPKLARGIGDSVRELKRGFADASVADNGVADSIAPTAPRIRQATSAPRRSTGIRSRKEVKPRRSA